MSLECSRHKYSILKIESLSTPKSKHYETSNHKHIWNLGRQNISMYIRKTLI